MQEASQAVAERASREFVFRGNLGSIAASRQTVMDFLAPQFASEVEEIDVLVALQEALANAVLHGCQNDPSKTIHCSVMIDPSAFTIAVRDPGAGFDVEAATSAPESGSNTSTYGRGIAMMGSLMDEVVYRNGGSEVQLRKYRAV